MAQNYDGNTRPHWSPYDFLVTGPRKDIDNLIEIVNVTNDIPDGELTIEQRAKKLIKAIFRGSKIVEGEEIFKFNFYQDNQAEGENRGGQLLEEKISFDWKSCCGDNKECGTVTLSFTEFDGDTAGHVVYELNELKNTQEKPEPNEKYKVLLAAKKLLKNLNITVNPLMVASQQQTGNGPTFREGPRGDPDGQSLTFKPEDNHLQRIGFKEAETKNMITDPNSRTTKTSGVVFKATPLKTEFQAAVPGVDAFGMAVLRPAKLGDPLPIAATKYGEGVTVVILDTSPDSDKEVFKGGLIDYWVDLATPYFAENPILGRSPEEQLPENLHPPELKCFPSKVKLAPNGASIKEGVDLDHDGMQKYHGLMVAALVRQVAPMAKIILLRVLNENGEAPNTLVTAALDLVCGWQNSPMSKYVSLTFTKLVINLSLGAYESMAEVVNFENYLTATNCLCHKGAVIVAASGNFSFTDHPFNPWEPAAFGYYDDAPDLDKKLITVAATGPKPNKYAWFSNQGNLAAPGQDILIDLHAPILNAPLKAGGTVPETQKFKWSGTSFAAPLVAGAAALLLGIEKMDSDNVKKILWESASAPTDWNEIGELNLFNAFNHADTLAAINKP